MGRPISHFMYSGKGADAMFEFNPVDIGITIVNLLVLFLILRKLLWKPVSEFLEKRRQLINDDLDNAQRNREEAQKLLEEHRQLVAQNKGEAAKIIDNAVRQADLRKDEIIAQAGQEAAALLEREKAEIAQEQAKVMQELREDISNLSVAVAEKMLARNLTAQDQEAIFTAVLEELESHAN
ncbi:MAG TPA: ATP synthase F0 subunit B [Firmicutes bacterium]|nr:ATP synthase F0 subunit B [Bacillota bacterium]HCX77959.1 ATP synthase F0 subunit B [Bacillota bacterium]